jgi:hypothetical protein
MPVTGSLQPVISVSGFSADQLEQREQYLNFA